MKRLAITLTLVLGCEGTAFEKQCVDQCTRTRLFHDCLAIIPEGPKSVEYNDWDEVVGECDSVSRYQSLRKCSMVAAECRP